MVAFSLRLAWSNKAKELKRVGVQVSKMALAEPPPRDNRFGSALKLSRLHWVRPEVGVDEANLLVDQARSLNGGETGLLRIAATPHVIAGVLAPFVSQHMARHPGIDIQLLEGGAASQPTRLDRGEAHLAIMPAGDTRLHGRLLYPVHVLAVLRADAASRKRRTLDPRSHSKGSEYRSTKTAHTGGTHAGPWSSVQCCYCNARSSGGAR